MNHLLIACNISIFLSCLALAFRLLMFNAKYKRYKPGYSFLAWVLINFSFYLMALAVSNPVTCLPLGLFLAAMGVGIDIYAWQHRGNVAAMLAVLSYRKSLI